MMLLHFGFLQLVKWGGGDNLDGQATLAAFTCQGTEAARYRTCKSATEAGEAWCDSKSPAEGSVIASRAGVASLNV